MFGDCCSSRSFTQVSKCLPPVFEIQIDLNNRGGFTHETHEHGYKAEKTKVMDGMNVRFEPTRSGSWQ